MKYKPIHSNFEEVQNRIISEIMDDVENIKDRIAEVIDDFVEAIIEEDKEKLEFVLWMDKDNELKFEFWLGNKIENGINTVVTPKSISVSEMLDDLWDSGNPNEEEDLIELVEQMGQQILQTAQKWRDTMKK